MFTHNSTDTVSYLELLCSGKELGSVFDSEAFRRAWKLPVYSDCAGFSCDDSQTLKIVRQTLGSRNCSLAVCWARCPARCGVNGLILL